MAKPFFDVFPQLNIAPQLKELLNLVQVEKVTSSRDRSSLRIYLESPRLIHKSNIYALEKGIKDQLFPGKELTIKIMEKYHLSGQYTPEKLLMVYKDSLLLELKQDSIIEYTIFRKGEISFPEPDLMEMTIEDSMVSKEKAGELKRILEKIFLERCGLPVEVRYHYIPATESKVRRQLEERLEEECRQMARERRKDEAPFEESKPAARPAAAESRPQRAEAPDSPALKEGRGKFDGDKKYLPRRSDNPDVLFGRYFEDEIIEIEKIDGEIGEVTLRGKIIAKDSRELRSGKTIIIFDITDFTDSITVKMFAREEMLEDLNAAVTMGAFIKIKGVTTIDKFDGELTLGSVTGIKKCEDFTSKRMDNSLEKRVELHCHTKMSDMDGVSEVKDIIKRAKKWGMPAIAVTDHGCVQSFPDANHALDKGDTFKVLYGVEGYLVDDLKQLVERPRGQKFSSNYVVFDIETTGFSPSKDRIIEIGAVKVTDGKITEKFSTFVNPRFPFPLRLKN